MVDTSQFIYHWNGATWSVESPDLYAESGELQSQSGIAIALQAIAGTKTDVWVVGSHGCVLHKRR
jgi:hypothetical protein